MNHKLPSSVVHFIDSRTIFPNNEGRMCPFIIGEKYTLAPPLGMTLPNSKVYELKGLINVFHDVEINSLIVKQIQGELGTIFTLSPNDCKSLGIPFEEGLQLFPQKMDWKLVYKDCDFNQHDLSTYQRSKIDNTIRGILIKLSGFVNYYDGYILSPDGYLIKETELLGRLNVISREPITYGVKGVQIPHNTRLAAKFVYPTDITFPFGNMLSSDSQIYLYISIALRYGDFTEDGLIGVPINIAKHIDPTSFFEVHLNQEGLDTPNEYENKINQGDAIGVELNKQSEKTIYSLEEVLNDLNRFIKGGKTRPFVPYFSYSIDDLCSDLPYFTKNYIELSYGKR